MSIFDKQYQLKPSAMATVAQRRFEDAQALCDTKQNPRSNGVAYLAGIVIEILLKAKLVAKFPHIAYKRQDQLSKAEHRIWSLIWRSHDLESMLDSMPELGAALQKESERDGRNHAENLKKISASWTIHARYSTQQMNMDEATRFLERVRSLKEVLK